MELSLEFMHRAFAVLIFVGAISMLIVFADTSRENADVVSERLSGETFDYGDAVVSQPLTTRADIIKLLTEQLEYDVQIDSYSVDHWTSVSFQKESYNFRTADIGALNLADYYSKSYTLNEKGEIVLVQYRRA